MIRPAAAMLLLSVSRNSGRQLLDQVITEQCDNDGAEVGAAISKRYPSTRITSIETIADVERMGACLA